ncbi:hypothetical protein O181_103344 [Austropuccinia psidii MF-1]|uniref:Alcohol dehydrogenase-like C-terminal domain-containing protein n=1 Tax=Austropuccinia psidii MF-1 TaxID=1389203 RepID=A0A9Q3PJ55_9BASI|nr:hypothetical protein [Austropuccinia psidii MF-1]
MAKPQLGTWQSYTTLNVDDVIKLPKSKNLTEAQAATMSVNMSTAYRLIKDYYPPFTSNSSSINNNRNHQWIIQNAANSSVGQYVLQLCKAWNIGCIGVIRSRPNLDELKAYLTKLGAPDKTVILTYDELADRSKLAKLNITLGLNCVSGPETTPMMKSMVNGSRLITYGGMSMKPLVVPTSLILFRDIKLEGFMLTKWRMEAPLEDQRKMFGELVDLIDRGQLSNQEHFKIVKVDPIQGEFKVREAIQESMSGGSGKKILFKFT